MHKIKACSEDFFFNFAIIFPHVNTSGLSIHSARCFRLVSPQECSCGQSGQYIWSAVKTVR